MAENIFAKGAIVKLPRENAPDWIKANISLKVDEFVQFVNENTKNGWVNLDLCESKNGETWYLKLNTYQKDAPKPEPKETSDISPIEYPEEEINVDDIPF